MNVLYFLVDIFIKTFGITQPTEKLRKQAAFFILALIILAILAAAVAALVIRSAMR